MSPASLASQSPLFRRKLCSLFQIGSAASFYLYIRARALKIFEYKRKLRYHEVGLCWSPHTLCDFENEVFLYPSAEDVVSVTITISIIILILMVEEQTVLTTICPSQNMARLSFFKYSTMYFESSPLNIVLNSVFKKDHPLRCRESALR